MGGACTYPRTGKSKENIMANTVATAFGATSTTEEVLSGVNLKGKRILVTGVSAGLGVETARSLGAHGAYVVGAARDLAKAEAATAQVRKDAAANGGGFELIELDLGNLKSVRAAADELSQRGAVRYRHCQRGQRMATPFGHTADGFETQFGTNHLGHFVFVNRIAPLIRDGGRLVNLSSAGHRYSTSRPKRPKLRAHNLRALRRLRPLEDGEILAVEFDKRHRGRGVRARSCASGGIQTELGRYADRARSCRKN